MIHAQVGPFSLHNFVVVVFFFFFCFLFFPIFFPWAGPILCMVHFVKLFMTLMSSDVFGLLPCGSRVLLLSFMTLTLYRTLIVNLFLLKLFDTPEVEISGSVTVILSF